MNVKTPYRAGPKRLNMFDPFLKCFWLCTGFTTEKHTQNAPKPVQPAFCAERQMLCFFICFWKNYIAAAGGQDVGRLFCVLSLSGIAPDFRQYFLVFNFLFV